MKKLFFLMASALVLFSFQSCGTLTTTTAEPMVKVVPVENATKDQLYVRANNWMVTAFNDAKSVVQFTDKESGTITGKYYLSPVSAATQYGPATDAYAIINIQVKDGASKITITPDKITYMKGNIYSLYSEENARTRMAMLVSSFEEGINKVEDDSWGE